MAQAPGMTGPSSSASRLPSRSAMNAVAPLEREPERTLSVGTCRGKSGRPFGSEHASAPMGVLPVSRSSTNLHYENVRQLCATSGEDVPD